MGSFQHMPEGSVDTIYKLPRGGREAIRLTAQHHILTSRQGYVLHPTIAHAIKDIPHPRIADVATGTGVWALDIAQQMPHASVAGLDISSAQFPASWTLPPNLSLDTYDLLDQVPSDLRGQFDVVHVRLLLAAGPNVDKTIFIDAFRSLLKPGGWLQWDELEFPHVTACYPSPKDMTLIKASDPGSHPVCLAMQKYLKFGDKASWIPEFEEVLERAGGFDGMKRDEVPARKHLLQMESDHVVAVTMEFVNVIAQRQDMGPEHASILAESQQALSALYADVQKGMLFSYNWNVCIARRI